MNRAQITIFSVLHTVAVLLLPLLLVLLGGCLDPEVVNQPGPEIPCSDVEKALNDSTPGPWTYEVGQFIDQLETAAPVNQPPSTIGEITQIILEVTPKPTYTTLKIEQTVNESGTKDTTEGTMNVPAVFALGCGAQTETYHNLTIETTAITQPRAPGDACDPKHPDCQIPVTKFKWDKLVTVNGERIPVHVLVYTSNEVPYLARILEFCLTYPFENGGQRIPVTKCTTVQNYKFNSN